MKAPPVAQKPRKTGGLREVVVQRPINCSLPDPSGADASNRVRCPNCKQFHLRPGYCQALDPINREKYPEMWAKNVTDNCFPGDIVGPGVDDGICEVCGASFPKKRLDARYCSPACREKASRKEKE